jgi:hypothetical protein
MVMKEFQWQTEKDWDLLMIYAVVGVHILVGIKHNKAIVSIEVLCLSFYHVDLRLSLLLSSTLAEPRLRHTCHHASLKEISGFEESKLILSNVLVGGWT